MTQTIQPRSWATLNKPPKDLPLKKPTTEKTMKDLRSLAGDLNNLQKDLEEMIKVFNILCHVGTDYLQTTQKVTQGLTNLIQIQCAEKGEGG
jgi:hypothetical protein